MKKGIRRAVALLLVLAMTCAFAFAADDGGEDSSLLVYFTKTELSMEAGRETSLTAKVEGADPNAEYFWESKDESVVKVRGNGKTGKLQAIGAGVTEVYLTVTNPDGVWASDYIYIYVDDLSTPVKVTGGGRYTIKAGESQNISASVSGGSGSYTFEWDEEGAVSVYDTMRQNATVYGGQEGTGRVYLTVYDAEDPSNNATVYWDFTVTAAYSAPKARLDKASLKLKAGETATLTMSVTGGSGSFEYYWESDNISAVTVYDDGRTATITATNYPMPGADSAQIRAAVLDTETGSRSDILICSVTVTGGSASFNASTSVAMGTELSLNDIAGMIADAFRRQLGSTLNYSASVRLDNPDNRIGTIYLQDSSVVNSYTSYVYATLQDMIFRPRASGTFSTGYTITDNGKTISGTITITVVGGTSIQSATLDSKQLKMEPYSTQYLSLSVSPRNADYSVRWASTNERIVSVIGTGSTVMLQTGNMTGTAVISAYVVDSNGKEIVCTCEVTVSSQAEVYNPTLTVTMGSDYTGTSVSDSLATRYRDVFGMTLGTDAVIRFTSIGSSFYGTLCTANGRPIVANQDYTLQDMIYMYFVPNAVGTYTLSYTLTYREKTLTGTISVYIKAANIQMTMSPTDMVLSQYSEQPITVTITPANAYYKINWVSDDPSIVSVKGNGTSATVYSGNKTGVVNVTAIATDSNGAEVRRVCAIQVSSKSNAFDPSVSTTLGVPYTGTGTSTAMRNQFYDLYGVKLDDRQATITFASTGNNDVGVMRLADGTAIRANTAYTFEQYIQMYTQPVATGTFSVPYLLSYSGRTLKGTVSVIVKGSEISVTLKLSSNDPYLFSDSLSGGYGGLLLSEAIRNSVGASWSYLRFSKFSDDSGTLYLDKNSTALTASTNVAAGALSGLYFKPGKLTGTFTAKFTVYNAAGGVLGSGELNIVKQDIVFTDVAANAYYATAVNWAVSKGITSGTGGTLFSPNMQVTRGQAVAFLWRAAGRPTPTLTENPFTDVKKGDYYYEAVLWALQQGIGYGTSATTFAPNATLNHDQLLAFLCRANGGYAGGDNWSDLAVSWARERGLLSGIPGTFKANGPCPRSDVVYYLWKNYVG